MEFVIRTGADKRKTKLIEEQLKEIASLKDELKKYKKYTEGLEVDYMKAIRRNKYLEKKVGNQNGKDKERKTRR